MAVQLRAAGSKDQVGSLVGTDGMFKDTPSSSSSKPTPPVAEPAAKAAAKGKRKMEKIEGDEKETKPKAELVVPTMKDEAGMVSEVRSFADAVSKEIGKGAEMIMKLNSLGAGSDIATVIGDCKATLEASYTNLKKLTIEDCMDAEKYRPDMEKCKTPYSKIKKFIRCGAAVAAQLEGPKSKKPKVVKDFV